MLKKNYSVIFIVLIFIILNIFFSSYNKFHIVEEVISPVKIKLDKMIFTYDGIDCFDTEFSEHNKILAKELNITEKEAFILGNLGKYWAENLIKGKEVLIKNKSDLVYYKYGYRSQFLYSGFCIKDSKPYYKEAFERRLKTLRCAQYKIFDIETESVYEITPENVKKLNNYIVLRRSHLPKKDYKNKEIKTNIIKNNIKVFLTDSTTKLKPDRSCSSNICQEILYNINKVEKSIDMAIYGYSRTYAIEKALENAIKRGVKIRLITDANSKGENIYSDTEFLKSIIKNNINDSKSAQNNAIMHNKFYIFDNKILITGSANLSESDMSGFNTNSIIVINSPEIADIYHNEFEQMYLGKFHKDKASQNNRKITIDNIPLEIYFSPQDKSITNIILPIIKSAEKYIYIPTFVLTEPRITTELINAKHRGVEVKIIMDALHASIDHSKHKELRVNGVLVKTENYAGKMHSKSIIVDDKYTIMGSMNFSNSGENKNDENLMVIKDPDISKFYKEFFLYQWNRIDDKWLNFNARAESFDSIGSCFDGIDNNFNDLIDSEEPTCKSR